MDVVWMYQHLSNKGTFRQFAYENKLELEDGYQRFLKKMQEKT